MNTNLTKTVKDPEMSKQINELYKDAISPSHFANCVVFALSQPDEVDINEIVFRPIAEQL